MATNIAQLRDIHLPDPVSIWPLAPGWYVLASLVFILAALLSYFVFRRWRQNRAKRIALKTLAELEQQYQTSGRSAAVLVKLSILLRRFALAYFPRDDVAGLQGQAWLTFLDKTGRTQAFSQQLASLLTTGPYEKHPQGSLNNAFIVCRHWIKTAARHATI